MAEDLYKKDDLKRLAPFFQTKGGSLILDLVEKISKLDVLNEAYRKNSIYEGPELARAMLQEFGIEYEVGGLDLSKLPEGPFITISNHPYGGADGLALVDLFGHIRPDLKVMVNKILGMARRMGDNLITVDPTGEKRTAATTESINGIKQCIEQIRSGGVLGLFPSGAVSDLKPSEGWKVRDREWQLPAIKLVKKLGVPVVPVRFFDGNSLFYYLLGLISWKVRLLKLPSELMNKKGKIMRIGVGEIITPEKIKEYSSVEDLRDFLRSSVYDMPLPEHFLTRDELHL